MPRFGIVLVALICLLASHLVLPGLYGAHLSDTVTRKTTSVNHVDRKPFGIRKSSSGIELDIDSRGLITFVPGQTSRHPIELLIERANIQAAQQAARIREVRTLEDAVEEYEEGFGMKPPRGFERW